MGEHKVLCDFQNCIYWKVNRYLIKSTFSNSYKVQPIKTVILSILLHIKLGFYSILSQKYH